MTRTILTPRSTSDSTPYSRSDHDTPISLAGSIPTVFAFRAGSDEGTTSGHGPTSQGDLESNRTPSPGPMASIERSPSPAFTFTACPSSSAVSTPKTSSFGQSSTPSISISPEPQVTLVTTSYGLSSETRRESLTHGLQNLDLASRQSSAEPGARLDLKEIGAAIDDLATETTDSNGASQDNRLVISPPRGHARRRSTPRPGPVIHRVEDEEPPSDEFHRPVFQKRLTDTRKLLGDLTDVLSSSSVHLEPDSTMKSLHERAKVLSSFQPLSIRVVGFVGDSGVGKSSLLNSLLDYRGLARTTNNGAACTCVVTEYHYHNDSDFVVEVECFSIQELHEQLAELLACYRTFHLHGDSLDHEARKDFEAKASIAADTFRAMFRGSLQDEDWLLETSQDAVLEQFKTWMTSATGLQSPSRQVASTSEQCSLLLMQLTSEVPDTRLPAVWPYIRKIKVFLKAHILSKGLVLVDLPGLRDLNSARRNITERYIRNCHEIFAVCNIGRATTDVGVKCVFDLARDARLKHVGIVCTKSDDIDPEEIKDDWGKEPGRKIRKLMKSVRSLQQDLKETEDELSTFDNLPDMKPETQGELFKFLAARKALEKQRNAEDYELKRYVIEMRNNYVARGLRETYQNHTTAETLHIFCVSNTMYWEKRMVEKSVAEPFLHLSGIIRIRKHCTAMVAASQLRTSTSFLDNDVPALLSDIELWVQSGSGSTSAEQKEAVRHVLDQVEEQLRKGFTSVTSPLTAVGISLRDSFRQNVWEGRQISKWTKGSTEACSEWDRWHHMSYAAFCRNGGNHTTGTIGHRNWNTEAMCVMVADLEDPSEKVRTEFEDQQLEVDRLIRTCFNEAMCLLGDSDWPDSATPGEIRRSMSYRKSLMCEEVERIFHTFDRNLLTLETDALTSVETSMFGTVMSKVYREAAQHYGRGSDRRRKDTVANTLTDKAIFKNLIYEFKNRLNLHADNLQHVLAETVSEHLEGMRGTLDLVRQQNVAEESERDPEFRNRVAIEVARVRSTMSM